MAENYTAAFARYRAKLTNRGWSVSAFTPEGDLVVSLWSNLLKSGPDPESLVYSDVLSKWLGNVPGRNELRRHLGEVQKSGGRIRLVEAVPANASARAKVGNVPDEAVIPKTFEARFDMIGALEEFDGDRLRYVFRPAGQQALSTHS